MVFQENISKKIFRSMVILHFYLLPNNNYYNIFPSSNSNIYDTDKFLAKMCVLHCIYTSWDFFHLNFIYIDINFWKFIWKIAKPEETVGGYHNTKRRSTKNSSWKDKILDKGCRKYKTPEWKWLLWLKQRNIDKHCQHQYHLFHHTSAI